MPVSEIVHEILDAFDTHDMVALEVFLADDFQLAGNVTLPLNKQGFLNLMHAYFTAFSDFSFNFSGAVQNNHIVDLYYAMSLTHDGVLDLNAVGTQTRLEPTGKRVEMPESLMQLVLNAQDQVQRMVINQAHGASMGDLMTILGGTLSTDEAG